MPAGLLPFALCLLPFAFCLSVCLRCLGAAKPLELQPSPGHPLPARLKQGEGATLQIIYRSPYGDRPQAAWLVLEGHGEVQRLPADLRRIEKTYRTGVHLSWSLPPPAPGRYRYHFEAASIAARARYPKQGDLTLEVESLLTKWLLLGGGVVFALAVLPGVVFVGTRRAADPAGAARTGLWIGAIVAYLWFVWLFAAVYPPLVLIVVGVAALALTVTLTRRRAR